MNRLGIYGGTFDPVHHGHLAVARSARQAFALRRVLFVPAHQSPLRAPPLASACDRLAMVRHAIADEPAFEAAALDIERPGPSFTIDTLQALAVQHPHAEFFLILGADALAELPAWRHADRILTIAQIIALPRSGHPTAIPPEVLDLDPIASRRIHIHHMPPVDIAASRIRARCAQGRPVNAWVPEAVADYIASRRLYAAAGTDPPRAI